MRSDKIEDNYKYEVYRKLFHLSSLWMVAAVWFLEKNTAIYLFAFLTIAVFAGEISRKYFKFSQKIYQCLFGHIVRDHEEKGGLSGAFFMLLSALITTALFSKNIAMPALSVMLISDSAAALIGRKFGKHKLFEKSIEGSIAFFLSAIIVISLFFNFSDYFLAIAITSFLATTTELFSKKLHLDDNLTIALTTGAFLLYLT